MQPVFAALPSTAHDDDENESDSKPLVGLQLDDDPRYYQNFKTKHISKRALTMLYVLCLLTVLILLLNFFIEIRAVRHQKTSIGTLPRPYIFSPGRRMTD